MPTPHINAVSGDIAKVVLMPGDPLRAKFYAKTLLHEAKLVNEVRGILAYTGLTSNGKRLTIMASGMGMPSIGIYSHELFSGYGVEAIIRVGTAGTYQPDIKLRDLILAEGACTDSNWMNSYNLSGAWSAIADFRLLQAAHAAAEKIKVPAHVGNVLSSDVFYERDPEGWKKWAALGVLGVEMETFALYANAAQFHKKALTILTVTDSFTSGERLSSMERQEGLTDLAQVALAVAEPLA